jgi:hypothetical protein
MKAYIVEYSDDATCIDELRSTMEILSSHHMEVVVSSVGEVSKIKQEINSAKSKVSHNGKWLVRTFD